MKGIRQVLGYNWTVWFLILACAALWLIIEVEVIKKHSEGTHWLTTTQAEHLFEGGLLALLISEGIRAGLRSWGAHVKKKRAEN